MRKIYGIGETVFDIIFKNGSPQAARPGGSVLNSMVSIGRIGLSASFISEYGMDDIGALIDKFLNTNGVDTSFVHRYKDANTSLAMAFLNDKNDAHYTFYKDYPGERLDIEFPVIRKDDIVQYGSFYAIWPEIREKLIKFIRSTRDSGGLILYDPNFRKSHVSELDKMKPLIIENLEMAGLIRGSDEDFKYIFGTETADEAWDIVRSYCKCLVYTANTNDVFVRTSSFSGRFPVNKIIPVSTIGAGDNFNAGMMVAIYNNCITGDDLAKMGEEKWKIVISTGVEFATEVCLSYENYISKEFAIRFKSGS